MLEANTSPKKGLRVVKRKVKVTSEHITPESVPALLVFDEYLDMISFETAIFSSTTALKWAKEIRDYAMKPDSFKVEDFFYEKGVHPEDIRRLRKNYEVLDKAFTYAKVIIGSRREKGAIKNDYNYGMIASSMSMYDPEWKANAEWKAQLTRDNDKHSGNVNVIIERYASTPLVPDKVKEE